MDNLFLVHDVTALCKLDSFNLRVISIDRDQSCVASLATFGMGATFLSWKRPLYADASVMLKVANQGVDGYQAEESIVQSAVLLGHRALIHIDPSVVGDCPFCGEDNT